MDNNVTAQPMMARFPQLQALLEKKWVLALGGVLGLTVLLLVLLLPREQKSEQERVPFPTSVITRTASPTLPPMTVTSGASVTFSPEQLQVIEEQSKADETVSKRETEIRTNYPWFIKLPLSGEKYFVYFETNRKVFVGLLYPTASDNLDEIKAEIVQKLKDVFGIPVDDFTFEWTVNPQ